MPRKKQFYEYERKTVYFTRPEVINFIKGLPKGNGSRIIEEAIYQYLNMPKAEDIARSLQNVVPVPPSTDAIAHAVVRLLKEQGLVATAGAQLDSVEEDGAPLQTDQSENNATSVLGFIKSMSL